MKLLSYVCSVICGVIAVILCGAALQFQAVAQSHRTPRVQLAGKEAGDYLAQTRDGQSLMQALTVARFRLHWQEHAPGNSKSPGGYLGMSHEQNLNAWFADDGVTVRPTLPETKRDQAWSAALRLKAYGYGKELSDAPPIVLRQVKENRIEYHRENRAGAITHSGSRISHPVLTEWYENKAEGIEQGFSLNERPGRNDVAAANEPLRVLLAVTGELRARTNDEGEIELEDSKGTGVLSYRKLVSVDADGKQLAARMEASSDGSEIALLVEDAGARYPVAIDPIMASLEQKLDALSSRQTDARFGNAVAIDGNRAVVGAWREDINSSADIGGVYSFTRSGTAWTYNSEHFGGNAGDACGWSVAISGNLIVYGCPGANNNTGRAFVSNLSIGNTKELIPQNNLSTGSRYGASVAVSGSQVMVGAPFDSSSGTNAGGATLFTLDQNINSTVTESRQGSAGDQFGTSVAVDGNTYIYGSPGYASGKGRMLIVTLATVSTASHYLASDGVAGDQFGQSVAINGNTVVAGSLNSEKGSGAGAAYVFVRDASGKWSQQQKLTASDGFASNYFSFSAVAVQGNTIVIGAYNYSYFDFNTDSTVDSSGQAYIFMRDGTVWKEQAIAVGDNHAGDEFGIGVGISNNSVIVGARRATASGVAAAGAAYVYRLDCVPPRSTSVALFDPADLLIPPTVCPGTSVRFRSAGTPGFGGTDSYQWRKNGLSIPGATSNSYSLNGVSASDAGNYDVIVSNSCGSDTSNAIPLTVLTFSLNPTSQNFGVGGSTGIVNVTSTGNCSWTAVSNASFITVNSGNSGTGNGTVGFTVAANPNSAQRTGSITIAGITFNVSQDGTNCSYSIAPSSQTLDAAASTNTVNVTASAGCAWTATSNDPSFLSINSGASGSGNGTLTYTTAANSTPSERVGTLTVAGQTFTVTQAAGGPTELANVSTRLRIETGDNVLFAGFIVTGAQPKKIIVLGTGPSLAAQGVPGALANPTLELYQGDTLVDSNDNWVDSPNKQAIIDSMVAPTNDLESAIVATLPANNSQYTAIVRGAGNGTGVGTVQLFDLDRSVDSKLANISTRGLVQTGDNILIAGTIVLGQTTQKIIIRAIGPSLPVPGKLADPTLELRDGNGSLLDSNDNWKDSPNRQAIIDSTVPPTDDLESAIVATLPSNGAQYTAIVRGVNGTTGVAVVEIYVLN